MMSDQIRSLRRLHAVIGIGMILAACLLLAAVDDFRFPSAHQRWVALTIVAALVAMLAVTGYRRERRWRRILAAEDDPAAEDPSRTDLLVMARIAYPAAPVGLVIVESAVGILLGCCAAVLHDAESIPLVAPSVALLASAIVPGRRRRNRLESRVAFLRGLQREPCDG